MSKEYIEKETALNSVCHDCCERDFCGSPCVDYERISGLPPAEVKPVVRGEWIKRIDEYPDGNVATFDWYCSICEGYGYNDYNFCPNCGAIMQEENDDGNL